MQIQIKTPKYMQKQVEIDVNRDIFAYICTVVAANRDIYRDMGLYWSRICRRSDKTKKMRPPRLLGYIDSRL